MSLANIAMIVFFTGYCINHFWTHPILVLIIAIAAGVSAFAIVIRK